jgi:CheY-like chemotaxis protein
MSRALRVLVVDMERLGRARFEPGGPPQLVPLDLKMPRMGGLEVLGRIRAGEATQRLPVVVLTSSERPRTARRRCGWGRRGSCAIG